ncbi:MAG: ABC transporter substrate-binding protein [Acidimicrobiales bacterium]
MNHSRIRSSLLVLALIGAAACSRSDSPTTSSGDTSTTVRGSSGGDATALDAGGFGDLEAVCSDGDASGATASGVTDTEIHVGTVTDKGFTGAPGLNKEMYDAAVAFTKWCNDHGGILGRQLVLDDLDAALTEYEARVTEACATDFALVGGGAVFDEDPNGVRVACGMPNIAGYVVSAPARDAGLQVQPLPNPLRRINVGRYLATAREFPEGIKRFGIMASNIPAVTLVRDQLVETATSLGYEVAYQIDYAPSGESGWANFVADMQAKDVQVLEFVGQPASLTALNRAMDTAGWNPDVVLLSGNFYDDTYATESGAEAGNVIVQSQFHPFELASDNKATQDYLDLMADYNPSGKIALLGVQGVSSWLLFARSAAACGSDLTAACLLEHAAASPKWTGGGLHAPQTPGNTEPSPCWLALELDAAGFGVNAEVTRASEGIYNCDAENIIELTAG